MFGQVFIVRPGTGHDPVFSRAIALGDGIKTDDGMRYHCFFVDDVDAPTASCFAKLYVPRQGLEAYKGLLSPKEVINLLRGE